jgi:hypothetical protein
MTNKIVGNTKYFTGTFSADALTEKQLDHLFLALALHTKTTRKEQVEWVAERRALWKALTILSLTELKSEKNKLRTKFFESPEELKKDPAFLAKAAGA